MSTVRPDGRPILLDLEGYRVTKKRAQKFADLGYVALCGILILLAVLLFHSEPNQRYIQAILMMGCLLSYALYSVFNSVKVERSYQKIINEASTRVKKLVLEKYDLVLDEPVVFDSHWNTIAENKVNNSTDNLQINQTPSRVQYVNCGRSAEVVLTLSSDLRDVTASIVTPAVYTPALVVS